MLELCHWLTFCLGKCKIWDMNGLVKFIQLSFLFPICLCIYLLHRFNSLFFQKKKDHRVLLNRRECRRLVFLSFYYRMWWRDPQSLMGQTRSSPEPERKHSNEVMICSALTPFVFLRFLFCWKWLFFKQLKQFLMKTNHSR